MPGPVTPKFNEDRQQTFLEEFAKTHLMVHSAECAGVSYNTVKAELDKNPEFVEKFELAKKRHLEWIDKEVKKRATGYDVDLVFNGRKTGEKKQEYNPRLLELYAKRRNAEYVERTQVEQHTTHKGDVTVTHKVDVEALTPEQRAAFKMLLGAGNEGTN